MAETHKIGIQMTQEELNNTFMMISIWEKTTLVSMIFIKKFSVLRVNPFLGGRYSGDEISHNLWLC